MKKYNILLIISGIAAVMVLFSGCVRQPLPITSDPSFREITRDIQSFKDYILRKRADETGNYDVKEISSVKVESEIAENTISSKMDTDKTIGQIRYKASYNGGEPDGCEYASVRKNSLQKADIHNFKKCFGEKIDYIGKTGKKELTDKAKRALDYISNIESKERCSLRNQVTANIYGFTVRCIKYLHDDNPYKDRYKFDSYKFVLLEDGKLLGGFIEGK